MSKSGPLKAMEDNHPDLAWEVRCLEFLQLGACDDALLLSRRNFSETMELSYSYIDGLLKLISPDISKQLVSHTCLNLLRNISEKCQVEDVIVNLVQISPENLNIEQFQVILDLYLILFKRESRRKDIFLEWCLSHLRENSQLHSTSALPTSPRFSIFRSFIAELNASLKPLSNNVKPLLCKAVLYSIGKNITEVERVSAVRLILEIMPDPFELLSLYNKEKSSISSYDSDVLPFASLGYFFYTALTTDDFKIPQVYTHRYIYLNLLPLITDLSGSDDNALINIGLFLLEKFTPLLHKMFKHQDLYVNVGHLLQKLNYLMVYNVDKTVRLRVLKCFIAVINCYDIKAQYHLFLCFRSSISHPGTQALIISKIKELFDLSRKNKDDLSLAFFNGKRLFDLLKAYGFLTRGIESDIVNDADQILAALNFFWYLVTLSSKGEFHAENFIPNLKLNYLDKLKHLVSGSLENCTVELNRLQGEEVVDDAIDVTVNDRPLSQLSSNEKLKSVYCARNALELIQISLDRIIETIEKQCTERRRLSSTAPEQEDDYEENIREKILQASLPFVKEYGWSQQALAEGARTLGYPGVTSGLFQGGAADLIFFFYVRCNNELILNMKKEAESADSCKEPSEIVERAIEARLTMLVPYIDRWPQALGIMSLPRNVPLALSNLLTLVDDICHHAGDKSVDFNWYSRRLAVAGIYKMTELCLVQDKSPEYDETWKFLHRRMEEAVQIHKLMQSTEEVSNVARDTVLATFVTARNILRLNGMR